MFAFGARAAILDGNAKRVLARHRGIDGFPGAPKVEARLWEMAESLLPERGVETYTQALMDLGATLCTRTAPRCGECPVAADCVARHEDRVAALPSPRPAKARPSRAVRVLVLEHAGHDPLEKRSATGIWAGLWSLPEVDLDADVARHCKARFLASVNVGDALPPIEHGFTHFQLTLHPQRVAVRRWPLRAEAPGLLWLYARRCALGGGVARADQETAEEPLTSREVPGGGAVSPVAASRADWAAAQFLRSLPVAQIGRRRYFSGGRQSRRSGGSSFS